MTIEVSFHPEAVLELRAAFLWYFDRNPNDEVGTTKQSVKVRLILGRLNASVSAQETSNTVFVLFGASQAP